MSLWTGIGIYAGIMAIAALFFWITRKSDEQVRREVERDWNEMISGRESEKQTTTSSSQTTEDARSHFLRGIHGDKLSKGKT